MFGKLNNYQEGQHTFIATFITLTNSKQTNVLSHSSFHPIKFFDDINHRYGIIENNRELGWRRGLQEQLGYTNVYPIFSYEQGLTQHQLEDLTLKDFIKETDKKNINFLALEEVTDARNIGSIIRSAASFNIDGIIVKDRSFPSKSKLLYRSASGGAEHMVIFKESNINTSLKYLKSQNFWISAFDVSGKKDFTEHKWEGRNVLLFGSEGFGLRNQTLKHSDFQFKVSISKNVESLNISNTVAIVCHHISHVLKKKN